ncbi:MAG: AMP-binding protein [Fibrobacterota bacterium]|nr:MAG: AMP-binding protein [Fibrobacterota bacterium]
MKTSVAALRASGFLGLRGFWSFFVAVVREGPNASALLGYQARMHPDRPALCDGSESLDWRTLHGRVENLAAVLEREFGVRRGARTAVLVRKGIPFAEAFYALCRTGAHVTVLNPDMGADRKREVLGRKRFDLVLIEEEFSSSLEGCEVVLVSLEAARQQAGESEKRSPGPRSGGRIAVLTGGTTGKAKTAQRRTSPSAVARPFLGLLSRLELHKCREMAVCSSVHHGFGLSALLIGTFLGPRLHLWDRWRTEDVADRIRRFRIDTVVAVPLMLSRLLDADAPALAVVRRFLCGGARLDPALARRGLEAMDGSLHNLFGSSEAGFSILARPDDLREFPETLGKPLPGVRVRILDATGAEVARGETGEISVESGWAMESVAGRTCRTGDLGRMDHAGRVFLLGRVDDMIVSGGENVYPSDLESAVSRHPHVREAVVWPVSDPEFGHRLHLAVGVGPCCQKMSERELRSWLSERIARYQMPAKILVLEALPWTAAGKPDRQALQQRLDERGINRRS